MLEIGDAGGGSAAQVAQEVTGTFTAGSTVTFSVMLNANAAGALAYTRMFFDTWGGASTQTSLSLDSDAGSWEALTLTHVLTSDLSSIFAEIWVPITSGAGGSHYVEQAGQHVYADNAVLTVTSVPAPAAFALFAFGLIVLGFRGQRLPR